MRSSPGDRLLPLVLYCVGVLQPVCEEDLRAAATELADATTTPMSSDELSDALREARSRGYVWHVGQERLSLAPSGEAWMRALRLQRLRDKQRLLRLAARAKGL